MKFLIVGHLCLDVIHPVEGPDVESYGGIYYSLAALASLSKQSDIVSPVFGVNKADYPALMEHLKLFPNVDTSGIFKFDEPTNKVHLYYKDRQNRIECSKDIAKPIPYEKIRRHLSVDGVLINMISGFDVTIETLDHIRLAIRSHNIPLHFDYHSLTLGVKENHERFRRPIEDWRRWAFMDDTVQLNEDEIAGLAVDRLTEKQTAGHLLTLSVKGVVVTKGDRGATLYYNEHKKILQKDFDGIKLEHPLDATGCGDVFGAAFLLQYMKTKDPLAATDFANRVAGAKVQHIGVEGLKNLRDALAASELPHHA
jgi:sugar/nucleoside kinase (ribokinase family)